ncbi:MAG: hypothetical protein IJK38_03770 [Oscillospiraceae bacterium]|nr:hypothetical protein [Oscillospiraceae bacterium]
MKQVISPEETEIMRSAYIFLSKHCNPPANQDEEAPDWWLQTVQEMAQVCTAWDNHPLIGPVLLAIIDYLEIKAKKKSEGNDHV